VALRHEVNLQTRAARHQQEHSTETLRQLSQALDALEEAQARDQQGQQQVREECLRPLLKTLVDLYDSLSLAAREVQRMQQDVLPVLDRLASPPGPVKAPEEGSAGSATARPRSSLWSRWFGSPAPEPFGQPEAAPASERDREARDAAGRVRQWLVSLITGYTMSLQRVERALRQHGLEALHVVGQPFDPESMEVVEVVFDSGRPSGEVVEEVRRGYLWNGRVFRFAQVRVAKA
jgi:molecular chaperone GrpE